jgi:hypothetical protein
MATMTTRGDDEKSRLWIARRSMASFGSWWKSTKSSFAFSWRWKWTMAKRKRMTPEERREYEEQEARWAESDREFRAMVERREQRLREWDEYAARRQARLRRLTFGLLGR